MQLLHVAVWYTMKFTLHIFACLLSDWNFSEFQKVRNDEWEKDSFLES
jgi:hypothetical protein